MWVTVRLSERSEFTSIVAKLLALYILDAKDHQNLSVCPSDSEFGASLVFGTCMFDNNITRITQYYLEALINIRCYLDLHSPELFMDVIQK